LKFSSSTTAALTLPGKRRFRQRQGHIGCDNQVLVEKVRLILAVRFDAANFAAARWTWCLEKMLDLVLIKQIQFPATMRLSNPCSSDCAIAEPPLPMTGNKSLITNWGCGTARVCEIKALVYFSPF
jgi:hypothetical protein